MTGVGIFLLFGMVMAGLAGMTLAWPGTPLDAMWRLNPDAYRQLAPLGRPAGGLFLLLSAALGAAAAGWFRRRAWGWGLAVAIIGTQVLGDLINFFRGDYLRGGTGFVIASALLGYLLLPRIRTQFGGSPVNIGKSE